VVSAHTASLRLGLDRLLNVVPLRGSKPSSEAIPVKPSPDNPPTGRSTGRASHSQEPKSKAELLRSIRIWLSLFIAGLILSGIPWRLIDCSFGVFGAIPLLICLNRVEHLEQFEQIVLTLNPADFHNDPPIAFH
jgi:hypothetical protein